MTKLSIRAVGPLFVLAVAASAQSSSAPPSPAHGAGRPGAPPAAISRANLDTTCAACQNFFQFANGGWLKRASIPAAYASWGNFNELIDRNEVVIHAIIQEAAADAMTEQPMAVRRTNRWKIGTFYIACVDSARVESLQMAPLSHTLATIDAIRTSADLARAMGKLEHVNGSAPFFSGAGPDPKNSAQIIVLAGQGGIGMPERDYYTRTDDRSVQFRQRYTEHVARMLALSGERPPVAQHDAERVLALETQLASASLTGVQRRDPNATYHKMSLAELQALTPHFDWSDFFRQQMATGVTTIDVIAPDFFSALDGMLTTVPVDDWKAYFRWRAVNIAADELPAAFVNEQFSYRQSLSGAREQLPRWKRCVAATNGALGEAVGAEYVKRTFTPEAKARALAMVDNLTTALRERIARLDWMSDSTKRQALSKLDAFSRKIGYPDTWRDYTALDVTPGGYLEDVQAARQWWSARSWAKLGKPVDRAEWTMTPAAVNASYSAVFNEVTFPAGILQPPFFDPSADDAVNYGAIGAVIGHEMSHGFDDQGRQFDGAGNLRDWWTAEDATRYKVQAQRVIDQFSGYTLLDSATHVNGSLTVGENIGDLGGVTIAYAALEKALAATGGHAQAIDGFTPEQRFFLSWAQIWRQVARPEAQRAMLNTDPHSPAVWRVNGPLSNMPEFRKAWGCKDGDPMVRPDSVRARIW